MSLKNSLIYTFFGLVFFHNITYAQSKEKNTHFNVYFKVVEQCYITSRLEDNNVSVNCTPFTLYKMEYKQFKTYIEQTVYF